MALKSVTTAGRHRFALHCDHCDRPIADAAQGSSVWAEGEGDAPAFTVHKGDCQRAMATTLGVNHNGLGVNELAYLPTRLEAVLKVNHEKASASAAFLDRLRAIGGPAT